MSWFRKRNQPPKPQPSRPLQRPVPSRAPSQREPDWRSYDSIADEYERIVAPRTLVVAKDLIDLAGLKPGQRAIDIGTGTGASMPLLRQAVTDSGVTVGVDPSTHMLAAGKSKSVVAAEAINLPFHAQTFDAAIAAFSIAYLRKLDTALYEVRRVLKTGATFVVAWWGSGEDDLSKTWRMLLEDAIGPDILQAGLKDEIPWGERLSDKKNLEQALRDAGFRPVDIELKEYRFEMSRDDYLTSLEIEAAGRYAKAMLGDALWPSFIERVRGTFAERFPDPLIDFRDVLLARGGVPDNIGFAPTGYDRR
ncbi:MAG: class I SAM-dependent methyltransferase [Actinomycetota bacterium]